MRDDAVQTQAAQEHARLDAFAQLVQGALLRFEFLPDGQGRLVYISEGCQDLWGLSAQAILHNEAAIWMMAPREQRRELRDSFIEATRARTPWNHEWRITDSAGQSKWLRGMGKPGVRADGSVQCTVFVNDVTDSVRARSLELTGQNYLRAVFDNIPGLAVQAFGRDRRIDYWNRGSERLYGYSAGDAISRDITELLALPQDRAAHNAFLERMLAEGIQHHASMMWQRRHDGSLVEVSANVIQVVHPEHGSHFISIDFDLSERRKAEDQRLALEAQLRESQKLEALGTLAGGIAHDFNNILAAILGNARLAQEDAQDHPLIAESVGEILKAGSRAKDLVQRILAFSRRQELQRRVVSLKNVVDESVRLLRATIPKGVALRVECDTATPHVLADPTQMQQVLLNLCTNAWQAMVDRSRGELTLRLQAHRGAPPPDPAGVKLTAGDGNTAHDVWPDLNARLTVTDNGVGMDEATLARLFEPFFTTKAAGEGTGLGLAVVHGILRDHQAAVHVRSHPAQGTAFDLYFRGASSMAKSETDGGDNGATAQAARRRKHGASRATVLYVDDDELIADLMLRLLRRAGYTAHVHTSPTEALSAVKSGEIAYDLAITDYSMPGMNGLDLARALRALHPEREVAITTGYISPELRAQAPTAGVSELIYKPNTGDELLESIERLASRVKLRRGLP